MFIIKRAADINSKLMLILLFGLFLLKIDAKESSKAIEGLPLGYLADCPGSSKESIITKRSLKQLRIMDCSNSTWRSYNYYQIKNLTLDFNKMTVLFVTGYLDYPNIISAPLISRPYVDLGYNVLALEMNKFTVLDYQIAARLSRAVGKHTAEMLENLVKQGLDPKKLQLIGISLGAQTASFIAKNFKLITGRNISRLTGLDPSGPCFRNLGPDQRIDSADADFVDIVSTNIDGYGMAAPVADVQFYVNGGEFQPGPILWYYCGILCSHIYSIFYWLSALRHPNSFIGIQCDSVQQARNKECYDRYPQVTNTLGLNVDKSKQGIFYLATSPLPPYYLGVKGLKEKNDFMIRNAKAPNEIDVYTI